MQKVLILDANQRGALAATRSLGKKGVPVVVADETKTTLAGSSRYCKETFIYPSPCKSPDDFIEILKGESFKRNVKIILPMTEVSTYLVLKNRKEFTGINIPFTSFETFNDLTDKLRLFELALQLGIPIPKTYFIKKPDDIVTIYKKLKLPVVLKPYRSRILTNGGWISTSVKYANSIKELEEIIVRTEYLNKHPFLLQEYIEGRGQGIFALYDHEKPITFFAHRRLREKPPSGGVSVLSESIEVDTYMRKITRKILDHVQWYGVAMVEFKVTPEGIPYLMEVNARFWGSLQLAIDAGVDFPWLLYQLVTGETVDRVNNYKIGLKNRWLLGDMDHLYMRLFKKEKGQLLSYSEKWQSIKCFLNFFQKDTRYEVNRWDDLKPFFFELKKYLLDMKS